MIENAVWRCNYEVGNKKWTKHMCQKHYIAISKHTITDVNKLKEVFVSCDICIEKEQQQVTT